MVVLAEMARRQGCGASEIRGGVEAGMRPDELRAVSRLSRIGMTTTVAHRNLEMVRPDSGIPLIQIGYRIGNDFDLTNRDLRKWRPHRSVENQRQVQR